jgi:pantoate kinase
MSGAGALSALLALDRALDLGTPRAELVAMAHEAEVEAGSGLGDVYPQSLGGIDIRTKPGAPPYGEVKRINLEGEVLLCVVGQPVRTTEALGDKGLIQRMGRIGGKLVEAFAKDPSLENLFHLARRFDVESGLADTRLLRAMEECMPYGNAAMSMLGRALFAMGDMVMLRRVLRNYGYLLPCHLDNEGARVLTA